jgi:hypothetical protein
MSVRERASETKKPKEPVASNSKLMKMMITKSKIYAKHNARQTKFKKKTLIQLNYMLSPSIIYHFKRICFSDDAVTHKQTNKQSFIE